MKRTLVNGYLKWLRDQLIGENTKDYNFLLDRLAATEFYALLEKDENRAADGVYLRYKYCEQKPKCEYDMLNAEMGSCRILEMLLALSVNGAMQISYEKTNISYVDLFWIMIKNLDLGRFTDENVVKMDDPVCEINEILHNFLDRKTALFGIQKNVSILELWEQLQSWIVENEFF